MATPRTCSTCGTACASDATFCHNCGSSLVVAATGKTTKLTFECPSCSHQVNIDDVYCSKCGAKQPSRLPPPSDRLEQFTASGIQLGRMLANVSIVPGSESRVSVQIDGDEELKNKVNLNLRGGSLHISCPIPLKDGRFFSGEINRYSQSSYQLSINGQEVDLDRILTILITIPRETAIVSANVLGDIVVGDTYSTLEVNLSGSYNFVAGIVQSTCIQQSGSGDCSINQIKGPCDYTVTGSGSCQIGAINGSCSLSANGSGGIRIGTVNGDISADVNGSSQITINDGRSEQVRASVNGASRFSYGGTATRDARISVTGASNAYLGTSLVPVHKSRAGVSSIRVGSEP